MENFTLYGMLLNTVMAIANAAVAYLSYVTIKNQNRRDIENIKKSVLDARSKMYIEFQMRFRELQSKLPAEVNDDDFIPDRNQKRIIRIYWYMVFDEWFACDIHDDLREMWSYYARGVESAFDLAAFRNELIEFYLSNPSLFGRAEEFFDEIDEIFSRKFHRKLESYKKERVPA